MPAAPRSGLLTLLWIFAAACSESDAVSVRVVLAADGSGTIATAGLRIPSDPLPYETVAKGAVWTDRANLYCGKGTFKDIAALDLAGIRFTLTTTPEGRSFLHVNLPCGAGAAWCAAFAPAPAEQRKASVTLDPTGKITSAGVTLKLEIEVPGEVAGIGIAPNLRGSSTDKFKQRATVILPIKAVLESSDKELSFDVTFKR